MSSSNRVSFEYKKPSNTRALSAYRKKTTKEYPSKQYNTWTPTTLKNTSFEEINVITTTKFDMFHSLPVIDRIDLYQQKYDSCIKSNSGLSNWIKTVQVKGPPMPLKEGYTPPSRSSRLPDYFIFPSLSSKPNKRKMQLYSTSSTTNNIETKSSFSTLLKKATDSLSYRQSSKRSQNNQHKSIITEFNINSSSSKVTNSSNTNRFASISTSLKNFSLSTKNNKSNSSTTNSNSTSSKFYESLTLSKNNSHKKSSTVNKKFTLSSNNNTNNNNQPSYQTVTPTSLNNTKKTRYTTTILPHSPSSVFLDRLRSPSNSNEIKQCQTVQSNKKQYSTVNNEYTPPSSPPATKSTFSPLQTPKKTSSHYYKRSQDVFYNHNTVRMQGIKEVQDEEKYNSVKQKKKRTSILLTPSLSTIRLISQKSHFLKRQSMLA